MGPKSTPSVRNNARVTGIVSINLLLAIFAFRVINALSIKTFFQPDEYFQSLEPAWQQAFGDQSGAWITWEWREYLRSSFYPLMNAGVYSHVGNIVDFLSVPGPLRAEVLIAAPKILQAFYASLMDIFTYQFARRIYPGDGQISRAALALTLLSPWQWFCSVRTLSNSLETTLTIMALNSWPWDWYYWSDETVTQQKGDESGGKRRDEQQRTPVTDISIPNEVYISILCAALASILRPTNILIWAVLGSLLPRSMMFPKLVRAGILPGSLVLVLTVAADRVYYGKWVFPPVRFLYFNVVQSLAAFYGTNRPDYYLTEGVYLLLTTVTPFAAVGLLSSFHTHPYRRAISKQLQIQTLLTLVVLTCIICPSFLSHKEARFIYPLLPMLHIIAAKPVANFFDPFPFPDKKYRMGLLILGLGLNVSIAYYAGFVHQRGVIDVMHYLRHQHEAKLQIPSIAETITTAGFLMPCHSTPWRSHLVYPSIDAWALTCEPPLGLTMAARESYLDEADVFYANPGTWIQQNMESHATISTKIARSRKRGSDNARRAWPDYLVFFQQLEPTMNEVLAGSRYRECWRGFNTHWHDDWRREGDVVVWCMD